MSDVNLLRKAAENLPGNWTKGNYSDGTGNFCAVGHLIRAAGYDGPQPSDFDHKTMTDEQEHEFEHYEQSVDVEVQYLNNIVAEKFAHQGGISIAVFNDHKDTTEEEVVAVLTEAADQWDAHTGRRSGHATGAKHQVSNP